MLEQIDQLRRNIAKVYLGNPEAIDHLIACLIARGHLIIEDVPGVGKTLLAMSLARSLGCSFTRLQLTPDLLPSDVLGVSVPSAVSGGEFVFRPGPIFANIVLADEINRTPPRTQSALLEAMNEGTVSIDGRTLPLEQPFMVIATQNPLGYEGTYPLPENQLDRFLMRISLGYPPAGVEARLLERSQDPLQGLEVVMDKGSVLALQRRAEAVRLDPSLAAYIVAIAEASRRHEGLRLGLSPRGSIALAHAARAWAVLRGRDYVVPEDITSNLTAVCAHRVWPAGHADQRGAGALLEEIIRQVPSPA